MLVLGVLKSVALSRRSLVNAVVWRRKSPGNICEFFQRECLRAKPMRILRFMLLAFGVIGIVISLPLLGFAALGYLGILADVGPDENQALGNRALFVGLPPLIGGVVVWVLGFLTIIWKQRHNDAD